MKTLNLASNFGKILVREKVVVILIIFLPILLVTAGAASAPDRKIHLELDDQLIQPFPNAIEISVALYAITSVVLISSVVSFYLGFNLKHIIPRLRQVNYKNLEIILSFVLVMLVIDIVISVVIAYFSLLWVNINDMSGYIFGLFLSSIIFSTIGLILAEIVDSTTLGLYGVLTLAVLDTAFLENPLYSRRYNDTWITLMPTHESIQVVLRSVYDTGTHWNSNILFVIMYELVLIFIYLIITKFKIGFKS